VSCISLASGDQRSALTSTRGTSMSGAARRAASMRVAGEVALAGIVVGGAGLPLRSFANLIAVDPGFRMQNILTVEMALPAARYSSREAQADAYAPGVRAVEAAPGVV